VEAAREILDDVGTNEFDSIKIKVENDEMVEETMENIDERLMLSRHVTERDKDYTITSSQSTQETINETMGSITMFLAAIAAVSLLVGAVGIANTMFTTVLEKTKEIGIMKAIGAKNKDIMMIFLLNSAMVGMVGGLIGITVGAIASSFISFGSGMMGTSGVVTPELLALGMVISVGIGVASGVIPAYRASKLKPVDALRYE
jgi:putative ABC transport system permease protein